MTEQGAGGVFTLCSSAISRESFRPYLEEKTKKALYLIDAYKSANDTLLSVQACVSGMFS